MKPRKQQQGIGLIEVMVAVVVGAVGVIGAVALSVQTLRGAQEAYYRAVATIKAVDMTEAIRAQGAPGDYLAAWTEEITANLPSGLGDVTEDEGGGQRTITVSWQSRMNLDEDGNPLLSQVQLRVLPQ